MLSERERNLLCAAYKASLAPRRSALKAISKIIRKEENEGNLDKITSATQYSMRLKAEAEGICCELLGMVQQLVLQTEGSEHIVFYHKMQGDYYRHLAEILEGTAKTKAVKLSRWKYDQAEILAERDLEITNPIRLAVALNYSILIAELDDDHRAARRKARRTYDAALQQLDYIPEAYGIQMGQIWEVYGADDGRRKGEHIYFNMSSIVRYCVHHDATDIHTSNNMLQLDA